MSDGSQDYAEVVPISDDVVGDDGEVLRPSQMLESQNQAKLAELRSMGASIPDGLALQMQLNTLLDLMMSDELRELYNFKLELATGRLLDEIIPQIRDAAAAAEANARMAALTQGVEMVPPKDIV